MFYNRLIKFGPLILLLIFYGLKLFHPLNLVTADLGRHLVNGRIFWEENTILRTNYYSFTETNYPVLNHHWAGGAVFYQIWKWTGFSGLEIFFIILSLVSFGIIFWQATKTGNVLLATLLALPVISLLTERMEIRPEVFTYLFVSIFWLILLKFRENFNTHLVWFLPLLQIFWVNTHIYFFLGPMLIGCFLLGRLNLKLFWLLLIDCGVILINPYGFKGAIAPLTIFNNYGYRLAENQPVWFIEKLISNPNYFIYKLVFGLLVVSFVYAMIKRQRGLLTNFLIGTAVSLAGWLAIRNFTLFGLLALPLMVKNFSIGVKNSQNQSIVAITLVAIVILIFGFTRPLGLGLEKNNFGAADFFIKQHLTGPIFNNYDIGSYLVYYLFPQEKVFVDNRPEAYPAEFFTKIYVPMQENNQIWQEQLSKYQFNAIIFSVNDYTPWGQNFLIQRVQDEEWAPVYVDSRVIIFLRRNDKNQGIISEYEISKSRFRVVKPGGPGGN